MDITLAAWREVSEHLDITESCERLSRLFYDSLGHYAMILRRLDMEPGRLVTIALHLPGGEEAHWPLETPLGAADLSAFVKWSSLRRVDNVKSGDTHQAGTILSPKATNDLIVAPLFDGSVVCGIVLFVGQPGQSFPMDSAIRIETLLLPIATAMKNDRRLQELERLRDAVEADNKALLQRLARSDIKDAVIGADTGLKEIMVRVEQVRRTDVPILLLGETGTGKEVIARIIHETSARAHGPMLRVNCGAVTPELVDSELFGHERGSFTGAVEARKGWFERADGGTLFLDEIGELSLSHQVRLLRVLQEGLIQRVGGHSMIHVDVRVVAATNSDLYAMVVGGQFREDLWYRLSVFPIYVPPLRERKGDIPALAAHFAARAGMQLGGVPLVPTQEDIRLLTEYEWPGNVRELNAVIERAAILGNGRKLHIAQALGLRHGNGDRAMEEAGEKRFATLEDANRRHIETALRQCRGLVDGPYGAAALLDINPNTLWSRMRKMGIDRKIYRGADVTA